MCGKGRNMKRLANALGRLNWRNRTYALVGLCAMTTIALPAQTFTTLYTFDGTDGSNPSGALVQATNGDLYGTTAQGGANTTACPNFGLGCGTVFKITTGGKLTTLYSFCSQGGSLCTDGKLPYYAGLVQATNGDLYGTTDAGGVTVNGYSYGTVFKITLGGTLTTLYRFCSQSGCTDGASPAGLIQAANGDFYGVTSGGGAYANGTVFEISPSGALKTLYSFCPQEVNYSCPDGNDPQSALVQATNGDFYGTTNTGGAHNWGTFFEIAQPSDTLTTLYSFCAQGLPGCEDGQNPNGLVQATNGDFYGTTLTGGAHGGGKSSDGTVFTLTPGGALTTLYSFCVQCGDGLSPLEAGGALVQATDGNFYGTTDAGGTHSTGIVFTITSGGALTTLYNFCSQGTYPNCADGASPYAGLVQATNGDFYGTTYFAGNTNHGTVFSLSLGLGPFVETLPTSGKVGKAVKILGNHLTGAKSVSFNGVPAATFKVVSSSEITTTVPVGATTGTVQVVTHSGSMLSSNVPFRVP
jgi:uncharacterized repeat protein (TIGR03803 family)